NVKEEEQSEENGKDEKLLENNNSGATSDDFNAGDESVADSDKNNVLNENDNPGTRDDFDSGGISNAGDSVDEGSGFDEGSGSDGVPGVIPSAADGLPYHSAKRTRLEYSTVVKTGLIDPASKNDYHLYFPSIIAKKIKKSQKIQKNLKKFEKFQQNNENNVKKITIPSYSSQKFTEVSSMHLLNDSNPKALKKASYGGSNKKIGCSWTQFLGDIDAAIDHVALSIDDEYVSYQHEKTAKITYFMFYNEESAEKCMNTPIYYNGIAVELYQTVTLEEGTQIITIPNIKNINIKNVVEAVNMNFLKNEIIYDFSAYKNK
ncbi:hypothetical protein BB561_005163, partial [Smittium simulii]